MTSRTRKLLWPVIVLLPLIVGVVFLLPAMQNGSELEKEKIALQKTGIPKKDIVSIATDRGASAKTDGSKIVVSARGYETLLLIVEESAKNGYVPEAWQKNEVILRKE